MSSDDNLYRAPQSSLQTIAPDGELTPAMVEYLSKGAFWARVQSVGQFIAFVGVLIAVVIFLVIADGAVGDRRFSPAVVRSLALVAGLPALSIFWLLGMFMHRYAKASKELRMSDSVEDAEQCFASSNSFFKTIGIISILQIVFGLIGVLSALGIIAASR